MDIAVCSILGTRNIYIIYQGLQDILVRVYKSVQNPLSKRQRFRTLPDTLPNVQSKMLVISNDRLQ